MIPTVSFSSTLDFLRKSFEVHIQKRQVRLMAKWSFFLHLYNWFRIFWQSCHSCYRNRDPMPPKRKKLRHKVPRIDFWVLWFFSNRNLRFIFILIPPLSINFMKLQLYFDFREFVFMMLIIFESIAFRLSIFCQLWTQQW